MMEAGTTSTRSRRPGSIPGAGITTLARAFPRLDVTLLLATLGIIAFSIYTLAVITRDDIPGEPYYYAIRQCMYAVVGIALMLGIARIDYSRFRELRVGIYTLMIISILAVFALGGVTRGSRRWIELPFLTFQPSEIGKVFLIVSLAAFALESGRRAKARGADLRKLVRLLVLGLAPAGLIFMQPDLDTAVVYGVITVTVILMCGINWRYLAALGGALLTIAIGVFVVAPAVGVPILNDYQYERVTGFMNPDLDPSGANYQIRQALIAVGSGGLTGRGEDASQSGQGFLLERHTDFIFAAIGERFGFLGAAFLLVLYALLIWRALLIATLSKNLYGTIIAASIAAMLIFQSFINVGMNVGIVPVAGIPLPLTSSGGSSVLATFVALGVLQSVYVQSRPFSRAGLARMDEEDGKYPRLEPPPRALNGS
jgi:rod shape determining protein RodA